MSIAELLFRWTKGIDQFLQFAFERSRPDEDRKYFSPCINEYHQWWCKQQNDKGLRAYAIANKGSVCFYRNDRHIDKRKTSNFPLIETYELEWNKQVNKPSSMHTN